MRCDGREGYKARSVVLTLLAKACVHPFRITPTTSIQQVQTCVNHSTYTRRLGDCQHQLQSENKSDVTRGRSVTRAAGDNGTYPQTVVGALQRQPAGRKGD